MDSKPRADQSGSAVFNAASVRDFFVGMLLGAKRLECAQLAAAFGPDSPFDSGSKLHALHTLREVPFGYAVARPASKAAEDSRTPRPCGDSGVDLKRASATPTGRLDYWLNASATRFEVLEIPWGSPTFHWLSLSSTFKKMDASPGGWSAGDSTSTKSGPICVMPMDTPLINNRISTWAECAP